MTQRPNEDLKATAKAKGVRLWQVAERIGCTEWTLSRRLRHELTPEEKKKMLEYIEELKG